MKASAIWRIVVGALALRGVAGWAAPAVAESRGKLPPQLGRAFGLPLGPKDSQGNLLVRRDGRLADPATGWAYEIWLKRPRMEFVLVPAGEFAMGCLDSVGSVCARYGGEYGDYLWEVPAHQVRLSAAFYVGKYEVTNQQFAAFRPSHSSGKYSARQTGRRRRNRPTQATVTLNQPNQPAVQVSWQDAAAFCQWLRQRTAAVAGLPTEAEWEWACRGGRCTLFHWGPNADSVGQLANTADRTARANWSWGETTVDDRYAGPAPVGRFPPNPFGLYDMAGNVHEWCADWFREDYYTWSPVVDPAGPAQEERRVSRGGGWDHHFRTCRSSARRGRDPKAKGVATGFRCVVRPAHR